MPFCLEERTEQNKVKEVKSDVMKNQVFLLENYRVRQTFSEFQQLKNHQRDIQELKTNYSQLTEAAGRHRHVGRHLLGR